MSTLTSPSKPYTEFQDDQTIDYSQNPNKIKNILDYKIKKFSKSLNENSQFRNKPEFQTEYIDIKESLNLEVSDVRTFHANKNDNYYLKTQKWMGHIIEVNNQVIFAKLEDLNNPTTHEIAEFDLDDIPYEDRELIRIGAGFYFSVGQSYDKNGQLEKKYLIRFQRTNLWDENNLDSIIDAADNLFEKLKWD